MAAAKKTGAKSPAPRSVEVRGLKISVDDEFMGSWDVEYDDTIYHAWVYLDEPVQCGH